MKKIKEEFLYYIWNTKQFSKDNLITIEGEPIAILDYGIQNHHAGPDFSNAKIKIGQTVWVGNVEMHVFTSDWELHKHQDDEAYENVILHFVYEHDKDILFHAKKPHIKIPTIAIKPHVDQNLIYKYSQLLESKSWIPCNDIIRPKDIIGFTLWKYNLNIQRFWDKTATIQDTLENSSWDWEQVSYQILSKYFGATVNKIPFEQLAQITPLKIIRKYAHEPFKIEALLFGQAGFLSANFDDDYFQKLKIEYAHLKNKYNFTPLNVSMWKFSKMRPHGFPTFRIAQLAGLLTSQKTIMSSFLKVKRLTNSQKLFECNCNSYWEEHYRFGSPSKSHNTKLTNSFMERLMINCVIPMKFLYGKHTANQDLIDECIDLLESLPAESNNMLNKWSQLGFEVNSAMDSQALIQLKTSFCEKQNCMTCSIGHSIFSK